MLLYDNRMNLKNPMLSNEATQKDTQCMISPKELEILVLSYYGIVKIQEEPRIWKIIQAEA